jgi:hypothetical protein
LRGRLKIFTVGKQKSGARFLMKRKHKQASPAKNIPVAPAGPRPVSQLKIPALLLEDDENLSGKSLGAPKIPSEPELNPVSKTTGVTLMPRDPHSLYAHWEPIAAQHGEISAPKTSDQLILSVHRDNAGGPLAAQIRLPAECDHAFVPVPHGATKYIAELCYLDANGSAVILGTSTPVSTPPESISRDRTAKYAELVIPEPRPTATVLTRKTSEDKLSRAIGSVPPPNVSWIPILPEVGGAPRERLKEMPITQEMITPVHDVLGAIPGLRAEDEHRAFDTIELENLLRLTMSQLRTGDSSF